MTENEKVLRSAVKQAAYALAPDRGFKHEEIRELLLTAIADTEDKKEKP